MASWKYKIQNAKNSLSYQENPLVIAEIGINHNGSLEVAKKMARTAIEAGIEVIKHQIWVNMKFN